MTNASSTRLGGIEAGRGVAALLVVLVHTSRIMSGPADLRTMPFGGAFRFGHSGVDFFFVLSGFIIFLVHYRDIGQARAIVPYALKRVARIYPAYWAALIIFGIILAISPTQGREEQDLSVILSNVFLLPTITDPILGVAWSLQHEILFYVIFGVLLISRVTGIVVLTVWGLGTALNTIFIFYSGEALFKGIYGSIVFRIFNIEFFVGMLVAYYIIKAHVPVPLTLAAIGACLFLGNGMYESFFSAAPPEWMPRHAAYAVGAGLLIAGLAGAERRQAGLRVPAPLLVLGRASYSIYLTHLLVLLLLQHALRLVWRHIEPQAELVCVGMAGVAVAVGIAFSGIVEQPLLRQSRRLMAVRPAAAAKA